MSFSVDFQKRFQELVNELELPTRTLVAEEMGITYVTFSKIYNYGIIPKPSILIKIADYLQISVEFLLGRTDDEYFEKAKTSSNFQMRLDELSRSENLTIYALAQKTHIHKSNIREWYKKNYIPNMEDLILLSDFFDVSIDYLLGRTDDDTPYKLLEDIK